MGVGAVENSSHTSADHYMLFSKVGLLILASNVAIVIFMLFTAFLVKKMRG